MTKFEQIGVSFQDEADSKQQAIRSFSYSCRTCCARGMRIECERCAIAEAHRITLAAFDSIAATEERSE